MGRTPDRRAGPLLEEAIILDDVTGSEPGAQERQAHYASGAFVFEDSAGLYDPRTGGTPAVFGTELHYQESLGDSDTTNPVVYTTKVALVTSSLPAGVYRVGWSFLWSAQSAGGVDAIFTEDAVELWDIVDSPFLPTLDDMEPGAGFFHRTLSGVVTFRIEFRTASAGKTLRLSKAAIELWRVS